MTVAFENYRGHLLGIAARITGSVTDAEDVVSEVWLRWNQVRATTEITNPGAWLRTVTTRQALDVATAAEQTRTTYIGPWLPDIVERAPDPEETALVAEEVDRALLRLLQELRPTDRAIIVLAEVAGFTAKDIAPIVGLTPAAVRQRLSRARATLATHTPTHSADRELLEQLKAHLSSGDLEAFLGLLAPEAVLWTDANGTATAARNPIKGKDKIARFLTGLVAQYGMPTFAVIDAVGGPALLAISEDLTRVLTLEMHNGAAYGLQFQMYAEKIHLHGEHEPDLGEQSRWD